VNTNSEEVGQSSVQGKFSWKRRERDQTHYEENSAESTTMVYTVRNKVGNSFPGYLNLHKMEIFLFQGTF
jgi:hypothetical protein